MNEETDVDMDVSLLSLEQSRGPITPGIINKVANLIMVDAYRKEASLIRFMVEGDQLSVFFTIHSAEFLVMKPPLEYLEQMLGYLRELCEIDEEASEGTKRWDKSRSDIRLILFTVMFTDNEHESGGKVVCEITLTNEKPGE